MKNTFSVLIFLVSSFTSLLSQNYMEDMVFSNACFLNYHRQIITPEKNTRYKTPEQLLAHCLTIDDEKKLLSVYLRMTQEELKYRKPIASFDKMANWNKVHLELNHKFEWEEGRRKIALIKAKIFGDNTHYKTKIFILVKEEGKWCLGSKIATIPPEFFNLMKIIKSEQLEKLFLEEASSDQLVNEVRTLVRRNGAIDFSLLFNLYFRWQKEGASSNLSYFFEMRKK